MYGLYVLMAIVKEQFLQGMTQLWLNLFQGNIFSHYIYVLHVTDTE